MGHSYDCAMSQHEALELFNRNAYSYILLDLEIPFCYGKPSRIQNGKNTLEVIRASGREIPVIVITSHGLDTHKLVTEVMRCGGADDFMGKPFPSVGETLELKIKDILKKQKKQKTKNASEDEPEEGDKSETCGEFELSLELQDGKEFWSLNSSPPRQLYKTGNGKRAGVMRVIYDFQHMNIIPHDYFLNKCGWKDSKYFLKEENETYNAARGPMKNHISEINKTLGANLKIEKKGIKLY
jgi:CheY-like chemotaxis protein